MTSADQNTTSHCSDRPIWRFGDSAHLSAMPTSPSGHRETVAPPDETVARSLTHLVIGGWMPRSHLGRDFAQDLAPIITKPTMKLRTEQILNRSRRVGRLQHLLLAAWNAARARLRSKPVGVSRVIRRPANEQRAPPSLRSSVWPRTEYIDAVSRRPCERTCVQARFGLI